jgi:hypothetical protein
MPDPSTLPLYKAYVENVKEFSVAETDLRRLINRSLKSGNTLTIRVQTKLYALLYSSYSEASFMKLILTPYGFRQEYLQQILIQESIKEKWVKCIELAFNDFSVFAKGSEIPNKMQNIIRIIEEYIIEPSLLRNKIAHGQLQIALNRKVSSLNIEMTTKLANLNFVTIYKWFEVHKHLTKIIEDLIESPTVAHYERYYEEFTRLESFLEKSSNWTIESKMQTKAMKRLIKHN